MTRSSLGVKQLQMCANLYQVQIWPLTFLRFYSHCYPHIFTFMFWDPCFADIYFRQLYLSITQTWMQHSSLLFEYLSCTLWLDVGISTVIIVICDWRLIFWGSAYISKVPRNIICRDLVAWQRNSGKPSRKPVRESKI